MLSLQQFYLLSLFTTVSLFAPKLGDHKFVAPGVEEGSRKRGRSRSGSRSRSRSSSPKKDVLPTPRGFKSRRIVLSREAFLQKIKAELGFSDEFDVALEYFYTRTYSSIGLYIVDINQFIGFIQSLTNEMGADTKFEILKKCFYENRKMNALFVEKVNKWTSLFDLGAKKELILACINQNEAIMNISEFEFWAKHLKKQFDVERYNEKLPTDKAKQDFFEMQLRIFAATDSGDIRFLKI